MTLEVHSSRAAAELARSLKRFPGLHYITYIEPGVFHLDLYKGMVVVCGYDDKGDWRCFTPQPITVGEAIAHHMHRPRATVYESRSGIALAGPGKAMVPPATLTWRHK